MKKQVQKIGIVIVTFLLSIQLVSAQKADTSIFHPSNSLYDRYMQRHKTFNTVGWVLLGSGAALVIAGSLYQTDPNSFLDFTQPVLIVGGGVVALVSVPFFIVADRNGQKARKAKLQLKTGNIPGAYKFNYVGVALKINL